MAYEMQHILIEVGTHHLQRSEPLANGPEKVQEFRFLQAGILVLMISSRYVTPIPQSISAPILSIFRPSTSTQDGNTLMGVVVDVTVGKDSLGHSKKSSALWMHAKLHSYLINQFLRTPLERQNPAGIGGCGRITIALGLVAITRWQQHGVGAVDVRQGGVKQAPGFILAGRGLDAYRNKIHRLWTGIAGSLENIWKFPEMGVPL